MASTYVNDLRLNEMATGDASGSWGTNTNVNLELISEKFGYGTEALSDASTATITMADGASDGFRSLFLKLTGSLSQSCTVTLAPNTVSNVWIIDNSAGDSVVLSQGTGANVTIPNGAVKVVATDGAGAGAAVFDMFTDLYLQNTVTVAGTTPTLTMGDAGAEDTKIIFDGNAKDFHIGLDDSADTLVIGDGSTLGTNTILSLTDDSVTIGDGAATDTKIVYDGNAKDFYAGLDDSADKFVIGVGSTVGTNSILTLDDDSVTVGDGAAADTKIVYDGNAKDFYIGLDDSADKLVIGEGSTVGTNNILTITDDTVTLGDAAAVDTALIFDGNAQDFHIALDDSADDLVVGVGSTVGSNTAFAVDENSKTTFSGASQFNSTVTVGVDDTGYDVKLFGATASKYMLWDESADSLIVKDIVDAVNYKINGGQGSDGQVLTSTGSGVAWEAASGGGKVLQVVEASGGAEIMTSGTFNSTGLYGAITPAATSSKVLVIAVTSGTYNNGSAGLTYSVYRGTTGEGSGSAIFTAEIVGSSGGQHLMATALKLDSPSSTSANTYTLMHKSSNGSSLVGWCSTDADGDDAGKLILIEIGA